MLLCSQTQSLFHFFFLMYHNACSDALNLSLSTAAKVCIIIILADSLLHLKLVVCLVFMHFTF